MNHYASTGVGTSTANKSAQLYGTVTAAPPPLAMKSKQAPLPPMPASALGGMALATKVGDSSMQQQQQQQSVMQPQQQPTAAMATTPNASGGSAAAAGKQVFTRLSIFKSLTPIALQPTKTFPKT